MKEPDVFHIQTLGCLACLSYQLATVEALLRFPIDKAKQSAFILEKRDWWIKGSYEVGEVIAKGMTEEREWREVETKGTTQ